MEMEQRDELIWYAAANLKKDELFLYVTLEEPYDGRLSRTVLWKAWGEIPLVYSTPNVANNIVLKILFQMMNETFKILLLILSISILSCKNDNSISTVKIHNLIFILTRIF